MNRVIEEKDFKMERIWIIAMITKYLFSVLITAMAAKTISNLIYFFVSITELAIILLLTHMVIAKNRVIGNILQFLLLLIYNAQTIVMHFSASFTEVIMLTNLASLEALSGKMHIYMSVIIPMVLLLFIPTKSLFQSRMSLKIGGGGILIWGIIFFVFPSYSPVYNLYDLCMEGIAYRRMISASTSTFGDASEFYKEEVKDYYAKPDILPEKPNIILIFTEGLSSHVISDERNIMPNTRALGELSLRFENYWNHSAFTYRGIIGQLYSGYQLENTSINTLPSMQSILKEEGYYTSFINPEPNDSVFTSHLESFGFDEVVSEGDEIIWDKRAYEILYETVERQYTAEKPFFTAIYTFGTHVGRSHVEEKYGDGKDPLLNRYYNADTQLGTFIEKFKSSEMYEDTILIFTTDHATCADEDFQHSFPDNRKQIFSLDEIPLYIYHKGIEPSVVDAKGRNSICSAATILDYLDITAENYFLGDSLFASAENSNLFDTIYYDGSYYLNTEHNEITELEDGVKTEIQNVIMRYFSIKESRGVDIESLIQVDAEVAEDYSKMNITVNNVAGYENILCRVWSEVSGEDDLQWYECEKVGNSAKVRKCEVDLIKHGSRGLFIIFTYGENNGKRTLLSEQKIFVSDYPPYRLNIEKIESYNKLKLTITAKGEYSEVLIPTWTLEGEQDDMVWYSAEQETEETWVCLIDTEKHGLAHNDTLLMHVYGRIYEQDELQFLCEDSLTVPATYLDIRQTETEHIIQAVVYTEQDYIEVKIPTWSTQKGQDDIMWYSANMIDDGVWICEIDLNMHNFQVGEELLLHVYGRTDQEKNMEMICHDTFICIEQ